MHRLFLTLSLLSAPLLAQQARDPKFNAGDRSASAEAPPAAPTAPVAPSPADNANSDTELDDRSMPRNVNGAAPATAESSSLPAGSAPKPTTPATNDATNAPANTPPAAEGDPPAGAAGFFGGGRRGLGRTAEVAEDNTYLIEGDKVKLQFPNNPASDLLTIYEKLTKMTLVKDTTIFEGANISLQTPTMVDKTEAIKLIEATLLTNGYAIIANPDGKSARILPTRLKGGSDLQFSQGVKFYTDENLLPEGETLVTYFMPLQNLNPEQASEILANHVGLNVYGRITPVTTPEGLLITESANLVRHLISIGKTIDLPATTSSLITKFIRLNYADATVVAQVIQATLNAQAQEKETKGITTIRGIAGPEFSKGGGERKESNDNDTKELKKSKRDRDSDNDDDTATITPSTQIVADPRLNQILVVGTPEDYAYAVSLIQEFDKPVNVEKPYERKLNYIYSVDVLSVLADLLKDPSASSAVQLPGGGSLTQQGNNQLIASSSSQLLSGRNTQNTRGARLSGSTGASFTDDGTSASTGGNGSSSAVGSRPDQLIAPEEDNTPISVTVSKTRLVADPQSNTIYVIGPKESIDKVDMLLTKLDQKPQQVYLATVIGQLTLGDGIEFGIDWLQRFRTNNAGSDQGYTGSFIGQNQNLVTDGNIADVTNNLVTTPFGPLNGLNLYGQLGSSLDAYLNAMETTNRFKVISRPSVFALNNKKATITSGQVIPVPEQSVSSPSTVNVAGTVTTTVTFKDVVLKLEVVPLINPNKEITLTIAQVNDSIVGTQRVEPNDVPIIGTEQLITTVTVPDGKTVVLGGLISEQNTRDTRGIPGVSRIPVLGNLFRTNKKDTSRKELIIFIQPRIVPDNPALFSNSANEDLRTKIGHEAYQKFPEQVPPRSETDPLPGEKPSLFKRLFKKRSADAPASSGKP
jgi:type II secretion system protein D